MSINRRMAFTIHQLHQRLVAVGLGLLMLASSAMAQPASESTSEPITESTTAADLIERGRYLSTAADCYACHTKDPAQPFAGGEGIRTPFGTIYPPNITPDQRTGIGAWTDDEFYHALHSGRGRHGENLYPAMPYDSFTQIRRDDVLAIKAYLFSLPAIEQARTPNRMDFPYNIRWTLTGWKMLNFNEQEFRPNPDKSDAINRGAYLASMAHCSTCHTPRTMSMGSDPERPLAGSIVTNGWYAPNITPDEISGIGRWSDAELAQYLSTGYIPGKSSAGGPMAHAIERSLSQLPEQDINDLIAWLRDQPAMRNKEDQATEATTAPFEWGELRDLSGTIRDTLDYRPSASTASRNFSGAQLYYGACASCHGMDGGGIAQADFPSLVNNSTLGQSTPNNVVLTILNGIERQAGDRQIFMPAFKGQFTDQEVATLTNWLFQTYGRPTTQTTDVDVNKLRTGAALGEAPIASIIKAAGVGIMALLLVFVLGWVIRFAPRIKAFFAKFKRKRK
ncbi:c-type cytochrome [Saezia sanguinis]|uniref:c-type cytochrome n=1 Tax=Saezia sanguinis TaxID=1965230 RepID=UPI00305DC6EE